MSVCSRAGRWREALRVFDAMKGEGVERDVFTHNTVLDALCKAGDLNRAVEVLECMGQEGVQPNVVCERVGGCVAPGRELGCH